MRRRWFLGLLSAAGTLGFAMRSGQADCDPDLVARLAAVFQRRDSAAAIGRAYLRAEPGRRNLRDLTHQVTSDLRDAGCTAHVAARDELRGALRRRIRDDFAGGRVVSVQGWIVSETEARLCAITALAA